MIHANLALVSFAVGTVIPLLVALLTKLNASGKVKGVLNLVLSVLGGALTYLLDHSGSASYVQLLNAVVLTYLASGVSYTNLWKPVGAAPAVAMLAPDKGLGKPVAQPEVPGDIKVAPPQG